MRPRLPLPVALCVAVALLLLAAPASMGATPTMALQDPITDNYKASYNADPSRPELRTWLAIRRIEVAGTTWAPTMPNAISIAYGGSISVVGADGRSGRLAAQTTSGPFGSLAFRSDPMTVASGGRWGILATVTDRGTLRTTPAVVSLTLTIDGERHGVGAVEYRHDTKISSVPSSHIEYNGPGGRWYVGGVATRTQEEPIPAKPPTMMAGATTSRIIRPRITQVRMPVRTMRRVIPLSVRGRAGSRTAKITHARVRVGALRWSPWVRISRSYRIVLPRGRATRAVRVQIRDARGARSTVATRRVRCICR